MTISDDGGSSLLELRIDKDTDISASPQPAWPQNIVGLFTQYDFSSPYDSYYQITPRSISDFSNATFIENDLSKLPTELKLYNAYPNPFNPQTTLQFDLPAALSGGKIELAVFNSLGQKVKTITQTAIVGKNIFEWNAQNQFGHNVASGIYYAILKVDNHQQAIKLILLK